jgi:hypothetical protein
MKQKLCLSMLVCITYNFRFRVIYYSFSFFVLFCFDSALFCFAQTSFSYMVTLY